MQFLGHYDIINLNLGYPNNFKQIHVQLISN